LTAHPGVEILTRDRWSNYAEAATAGAPKVTQVADRFHLVRNVRELVERILDAHSAELDGAFAEVSPSAIPTDVPEIPVANMPSVEIAPSEASSPTAPPPSPHDAVRSRKRSRREARFAEVRQRHAEGQSLRSIAHELRMARQTVQTYLRIARCPDWQPSQPRPTRVDRYQTIVDEFIREGGRQATQVLPRLRDAGCRSSYDAVRRFFRRRLAAAGIVQTRANSRSPPKPKRPTARQLSFEYVRRAEKRTVDQQQHILKLGAILGLANEWTFVDGFLELVRGTSKSSLSDWLTPAEQSSSCFIRSFAKSIRSDEAAVSAAMTTAWSNGPVEGQVNRLKAIKRSMYGRAKLPLLNARVCGR
jgi:transposase